MKAARTDSVMNYVNRTERRRADHDAAAGKGSALAQLAFVTTAIGLALVYIVQATIV